MSSYIIRTQYVIRNTQHAAPIWDPYTEKNKSKIKMEQRAVRYVRNDYQTTSSVTNMLCELGGHHLRPGEK